ncbi:hypothetical protein [Rhizobium glycinendophyticum]|uniref:Bacterial virulence domain-containing protein n=1 Tax=Rhizobium glycinendophyticum TaxID=2589807 RepID=A0A504UAG4_9HYPH|nr:hypothetical protein [Rhizobium glycinendophyticum]TPP10270.1 hypothetical protein FJQ55_05225 [Rhizobium glycinendophyticum]
MAAFPFGSPEPRTCPGRANPTRLEQSHSQPASFGALGFLVLFTAVCSLSASVQAASEVRSNLPQDNILVPDDDSMNGVVFVLSDANGWDVMEQTALDAAALSGAIAVGVDLRRWRAALSRETERDCLFLPAEIEHLAHQLRTRTNASSDHPPRIVGFGEGAALALAIVAQTPNGSFAQTIGETLAVDPTEAVALPKRLCMTASQQETDRGYVYDLSSGALPNPVRIVLSASADPRGRAHAEALKRSHPDIVLSTSPGGPARALAVETTALAARLGTD